MVKNKIAEEIEEILDFSGSTRSKSYYFIENSEGKSWIIPHGTSKNIKVALEIYQPSNLKGKLFKLLFPYLAKSNKLTKELGISIVKLNFKSEFLDWMKEVFQSTDLNFTFFQGTPSSHRKSTIQVSDKQSNILGYIKLSTSSEVSKLIENESDFLRRLSEMDLNIPELLGCKQSFLGEISIMIQSTKKKIHSTTSSFLKEAHFEFENELFEKSKKKSDYSQTKYFMNQNKYVKVLDELNDVKIKNELKSIKETLDNKYMNTQVEFSISNRDFTPWNMCFTDKKLFVFDWEYASEEYPRFYDLFHFFTQNSLLVDKLTDDNIILGVEKLLKVLEKKYREYSFETLESFYLMYLLDITLFYLNRDPNKKDLRWVGLMNKIKKGELG